MLDREDVYDAFVASSTAASAIAILDKDTKWIWDLFPLVLHWRLKDIPVTIFAPKLVKQKSKITQIADETRRRALLEGLGCNLIQLDVAKRAFVINPNKALDTTAFVFEHENEHQYATCRRRSQEPAEFASIDSIVTPYLNTAAASFYPTIASASESEITDRLTGSHGPAAYKQSGVTMTMEDVPLAASFSISLAVRTYRFRQVDLMANIFAKYSLPLFTSAGVTLLNGSVSYITPPVVELHNGKHVFIEGNTRALHTFCNGATNIRALVVKGTTMSLPAKENPLGQVFLCRLKLPAAWRQLEWNYGAFRNVEAAMHNYP